MLLIQKKKTRLFFLVLISKKYCSYTVIKSTGLQIKVGRQPLSNYEATFSSMLLVFLELDTYHSYLGFNHVMPNDHWKFMYQYQTQSIFGDTVYSSYCKFRLVTSPWWGLRGQNFLILTTLDRWKRHFREQSYIENYFYLLKSTKNTKITSQKCWRNIIWVDFFGRSYRSNGIKTRLGSPVYIYSQKKAAAYSCRFVWVSMIFSWAPSVKALRY